MTAAQALTRAIAVLRAAQIDDPARDARRLLAHVLTLSPARLTLVLPDPIDTAQAAAFDALIAQRAARAPVSHLIGSRAFFGRDFRVSAAVLDPRPETETLVEQALESPFSSILDMGTGSGCIALSVLAERPAASGLGTDLSAAALDVARDNAARLGLVERVTWAQGAWFAAVPPDARFDLILSNPPYIAKCEMPGLAPELGFEPRIALTDEADGLTAYRVLADQAGRFLTATGRLIVEIGPTQGPAVVALFRAAGFDKIRIHPDLDGRDRVVSAQIP